MGMPLVINGDDPLFQREWANTIKGCQMKMITTIQRHLGHTTKAANVQIREETDNQWSTTKRMTIIVIMLHLLD